MTPLEVKIYDVLAPMLPLLIVMDQNAPRPTLPYAAFRVNSFRVVMMDEYFAPNDAGVQSVSGNREFTVNLQYYGSEAVEKLQLVRDKLRLQSVMDAFLVRGLAAYSASAVMDISERVDTRIEKRANLDIMMRYRSLLTDDVGYIDKAHIEGTVDTATYVFDVVV